MIVLCFRDNEGWEKHLTRRFMAHSLWRGETSRKTSETRVIDMYGVYFKICNCMIVSPKVLRSKKPNENVQAEDKQCKTYSLGSEPPDSPLWCCDCDRFTAIICHQKSHYKAWRKQELLLENQNQIMENLRGITNLLKERRKKEEYYKLRSPVMALVHLNP